MTRTERTYYFVSGGYNLAQFFLAPFYPLFLLSRGLDLFQINVVLAVYLVTIFAFEIPTGAIADRFGRKWSFMLACLVRMGAFALYARTQTFGDCLVAELFDAVGTTLASGALEAWAVDGVRAEGDERPTDRMFARALVIARVLTIGGGILCGYLAEIDFAWPWLVAAAVFGVTGAVGGLFMREPRGNAPAHPGGARSLRRTALDALLTVRASPVLLLLCLLTFAAAFGGLPVFMTWQARMEALSGQGPWLMGWLQALLNVAALAGSAILPRVLDRFGRATVLSAAYLWRSLMLALSAAAAAFAPALAGLVLQEIGLGMSDPVFIGWANEHARAEHRATVLSVRSAFLTLGGATGLVVLGLVARRQGIPAAWALSAAAFLLTVPGYRLLGRVARSAGRPAAPEVELVVGKAGVPPVV